MTTNLSVAAKEMIENTPSPVIWFSDECSCIFCRSSDYIENIELLPSLVFHHDHIYNQKTFIEETYVYGGLWGV